MPAPEMLIGSEPRFRRRLVALLVAGSGLLVIYFALIGAYFRYAYLETRTHILWVVEGVNSGQYHDTTPEGHVQVYMGDELITINSNGEQVASFDDFLPDSRFRSNFYTPDGYMVVLCHDSDWTGGNQTTRGQLALYSPEMEPCWKVPVRLKGMIYGIAVCETVTYILSEHAIYCYSREGTFAWKLDQDMTSSYGRYSSSCIDDNGVLYTANEQQQMWAIAPDGSTVYTEDTYSYGNTSPVIGPDGNLYVITWNDEFIIINQDGQILFARQLPATASINYTNGGPFVAVNGHGQIAVLTTTMGLHCFSPEWELVGDYDLSLLDYPEELYYSDSGRIYTGNYNRGVLCFSSSGRKLWHNRYVDLSARPCGTAGVVYVLSEKRLLGMSL